MNLEDETSDLVNSTHEVNNGSLRKMGFTKINGRWVSKDGDYGGSSGGAHAEHDEEDKETADMNVQNEEDQETADMNVQNEEQPTTDLGVGTSVRHQGNKPPSMSSFESYMVNRLNRFAENQRNLHGLCVTIFQNFDNRFQCIDTHFQTLDEQIEVVRTSFLSCSIGKKIEEKQSVDIMKQPIMKLGRQVFVVLSMCVLLYFELFCFHLFLKSICEDK